MQFSVYVTAKQYAYVHVEAEDADAAKQEIEKLFNQHRISWHDEEITDMIFEKVHE